MTGLTSGFVSMAASYSDSYRRKEEEGPPAWQAVDVLWLPAASR
jgi:hypothetical protein